MTDHHVCAVCGHLDGDHGDGYCTKASGGRCFCLVFQPPFQAPSPSTDPQEPVMIGKWCSYCEAETPMQVVVVIELCLKPNCANTERHVHGASRTEDQCGTCGTPTKITENPNRSHP